MALRFNCNLLLVLFLLPILAYADNFEPKASYTVCFTPGENCTQKIVDVINSSVSSIWVQAYSFTSRPISNALAKAQDRGVKVGVIIDKSALVQNQKLLAFFARRKINVWIDKQPAIAHNKVMVIDQTQVITGSFNFTYAAQQKNAENVLIISDEKLAKKYLQNWQRRQAASDTFTFIDTAPQQQHPMGWFESLFKQFLSWLENLLKRPG